jgi:DNA-binding response OmpR family regulator
MRVLLVEDDPVLAGAVVTYLRGAGFAVDTVATGQQALVESAVTDYDAIVLDWPAGRGRPEVCRRSGGPTPPVS